MSSLSALRRRPTRSSRMSGVATISRPPVLLSFVKVSPSDFSRHTPDVVIEAGHVGQPRFKHIVEVLPRVMTTALVGNVSSQSDDIDEDKVSIDTTSADSYYRMYADTLEHVFHLLGQDAKDRRVIILHNSGLFVQRAWKMAIARILQEVMGVPAVSFQPSVSMVPFAFPPDGSGNAMLVVHVTLQEAHCIVSADKIVLDYTYQTCSYPVQARKAIHAKLLVDETLSISDVMTMQASWLTNSPDEFGEELSPTSSLVIAILKTLELCPRQLRLRAIHNLVFSGNIIDPLFGIKIAKKIETELKREPNLSKERDDSCKEADSTTQIEEASTVKSTLLHGQSWTYSPFNRTLLRPLADHVAVVKFVPNQIRPDLLSWIGASAWAAYWHEQDPESKQLHWEPLTNGTTASGKLGGGE